MKKRPQFTLYFDEDLVVWLRSEAKRLRCSMSAVVRGLIVQAMCKVSKREEEP